MHHLRQPADGPPLVLLHGVGHHAQAWLPVMERLDDFDIYSCDSPGFGRSERLPESVEPTIGAYADAFEAFFAEQGLDRPHVAGNSMGGAIVLELARRGAVRSATAISPAGFWTPAERRYTQTVLGALAHTPRRIQSSVITAALTRPGLFALRVMVKRPASIPADDVRAMFRDAFAAPAFAAALKAFDGYTFVDGHELDDARVTVAWGDADRILPFKRQAPRARAALKQARHVTLDAGHLPYHDCPDVVADVIRTTATAS
ncbi:alpha/beta fold hydrolase [Aeromicrobium terrae]|uniref:Alpha/beta hydrolase n=1 Tax=Aeromicrobium terrae TaxID=2498846 RepID=A0A5C8NHI7_9ACTN|nr:alpha/beta hydrolase [Aeromicrobium terrae]TXL61334.1 alpha/beta hydrolase [Aeromicrobium terrae]